MDELSLSVEHELAPEAALRVSYVRKLQRSWWGVVNVARTGAGGGTTDNLTKNATAVCSGCPPGQDGTTLNLRTVEDDQVGAIENVITNGPSDETRNDFDTVQLALTRRFRSGWFINANLDYQWRHEMRRATGETQSQRHTDPLAVGWYLNYSRDVTVRQKNTAWGANLMTRYVTPQDVGLSATLRHQSGHPWAPFHRLRIENVRTQAVLLQDVRTNRSDHVFLADIRADKTFRLGGRCQLSAMADVYNLLNANPETNFVMRTGRRFDDVIEWLQGRTFKIGLRVQF